MTIQSIKWLHKLVPPLTEADDAGPQIMIIDVHGHVGGGTFRG